MPPIAVRGSVADRADVEVRAFSEADRTAVVALWARADLTRPWNDPLRDIDRKLATFSVNLIPETLARTNFSLLKADDEVNVEIDQQTQVIVETVERVMADRVAEPA